MAAPTPWPASHIWPAKPSAVGTGIAIAVNQPTITRPETSNHPASADAAPVARATGSSGNSGAAVACPPAESSATVRRTRERRRSDRVGMILHGRGAAMLSCVGHARPH